MECRAVRKILKEYANDEICDREQRLTVEAHVSGCEICKRELLLWQEVMDKQRAVRRMQANMPSELKDRVKIRMQNNQKDANLPPLIRRMKAMGGLFSSGRGQMIILTVLMFLTLIYILSASRIGKSIGPSMLILFGFLILFILVIFKKNK